LNHKKDSLNEEKRLKSQINDLSRKLDELPEANILEKSIYRIKLKSMKIAHLGRSHHQFIKLRLQYENYLINPLFNYNFIFNSKSLSLKIQVYSLENTNGKDSTQSKRIKRLR